MSKSFVTMVQRLCSICTKPQETNEILFDRRLKERFDHYTVTGFGPPCSECQKLLDDGVSGEGRIALIGVDPSKSGVGGHGVGKNATEIKPDEAYRTGKICFLERWAWSSVFDIPIPGPIVFLDDTTISMVEKRAEKCCKFLNARSEYLGGLPDDADKAVAAIEFAKTYVDPEDRKVESNDGVRDAEQRPEDGGTSEEASGMC